MINITMRISLSCRLRSRVSYSVKYDGVLIENEIASGLNVDDLTEFFDKVGHNLMVFADIDARRHVRKLANNFGIDFEAYVS